MAIKKNPIWDTVDASHAHISTISTFSFTNADFPLNIYECAKTEQTKDYTIHRAQPPFYIIEYILSGSGTITFDNKTHHTKAGDMWLIHKNMDEYSYRSNPKDFWQKIYIHLDGILLSNLISAYNLKDMILFSDLNQKDLFLKLYEVTISGKEPFEILYEISIYLHKILQSCYILTNSSNISVTPYSIRRALQKGVYDREFEIKNLAKNMVISETHLINVFKKEYNVTPYQYLLDYRIKTAANMLISTELSIERIADQLNFCDANYFSKVFKAKKNMSPLQYRKNMRESEDKNINISFHET